jgi:hypothetical protein
MLVLLDISSGGIYNYLLQSRSHCNDTALILHRLTTCILLPQLFTSQLIHCIRLDRTALADLSVVTTHTALELLIHY